MVDLTNRLDHPFLVVFCCAAEAVKGRKNELDIADGILSRVSGYRGGYCGSWEQLEGQEKVPAAEIVVYGKVSTVCQQAGQGGQPV